MLSIVTEFYLKTYLCGMEVLTEVFHESHDQDWELRKRETETWETMWISILETEILLCFTNPTLSLSFSHILHLAIEAIAFWPFWYCTGFCVIIISLIPLSSESESLLYFFPYPFLRLSFSPKPQVGSWRGRVGWCLMVDFYPP